MLRAAHVATCFIAGLPNDVCPYGQVMSASPNDVAFGCDVVPSAQWASITSLATNGSSIAMSEAKNITLFHELIGKAKDLGCEPLALCFYNGVIDGIGEACKNTANDADDNAEGDCRRFS